MLPEERVTNKVEALLTPEVIKAQKEYVVKNFYDLMRALIENPTWLEIMRNLILTEELLRLPQKVSEILKELEAFRKDFETFKKEEFTPLKQKVDRIEKDVETLKQDVEALKQDVATLKRDVAYLKVELGKVKGWAYEWKIKENYHAYFGRVLRRARRISLEELANLAADAEEKGLISEKQYIALLELDLVVEGLLKHDKRPVVLAIEISHKVFVSDLERAFERANILAYLLGKEVIPTVIGSEVEEEISELADERGVLLIEADV